MDTSELVTATILFATTACSASVTPRATAASAACERLGDTSQTVSAFLTSGDAYHAERATEDVPNGRSGSRAKNVGADLYVRATPGTSGEYLQRTLECYSSASRPVHANDPFHVASGSVQRVSVSSAGNGYLVRIEGSNPEAAEDIWQRAQALTSTVTAEQLSMAPPSMPPL
jgi:hypothetical protein